MTDSRTGLTTKCVQKLYHTTQTVHIQGGQRIGKTTTISVLADYLEKEWAEIMETEKDKIEYNTQMLANLDVNKVQQNKRPNIPKKADMKCTCTICPYKSKFLYQMKIHMYSFHQITDTKAVKKSCVKPQPLSFQSVKKELAVKRVRIAKPEVAEPKDEYIQHYNTPRTTPEQSPVKKKIKETPSKEGENLLNKEVKKSIKEDEPNKPVDGDGQKEESSSKNDDVASEVVVLVDNLENELEGKNKRIKFLESENLKRTMMKKRRSMILKQALVKMMMTS